MFILTFFFGLFGTIVGSFLGVVIDRVPLGKSIIWGRSHCDYCQRDLRWFELVPIFSYVIQRGKCLRCKRRLSWRYPLIEVLTGVLFGVLWIFISPSLLAYFSAVIIGCSLLCILVIDLDHMIIPDGLVLTTTIGAIMYHIFSDTGLWILLQNYVLTGIGSYIIFYGLWRITKRRGIGFGDVKLSFALGLIVGSPQVIISLYGAFLTGAIVGIILLLYGRKTMKSAVPFGPFLILGVVIACFLDARVVLLQFL